MKLFKTCFLLLLIFSFTYCSKDKADEIISKQGLDLSTTSVRLDTQTTFKKVSVLNAKGNYTVRSLNSTIAEVRLVDNEFVIIGIGTGKATILVQDSEDRRGAVDVEVSGIDRPATKSYLIYVKKNTTRTLHHPYPREEGFKLLGDLDNELINISSLGRDKLKIVGKELGSTDIIVEQDYWNAVNYKMKIVDVYPLLTTIGSHSTDKVGLAAFLDIIKIGNGGYKIESADSAIAIGSIEPYLPSSRPIEIDYYNEVYISYETFGKVGTTTITITDAAGLKAESHITFKAK